MAQLRSKIGALLVAIAAMMMLSCGAQAATYKVLYSFCKKTNCQDGSAPNGLVRDAAGNLFGTTRAGGAHHLGAIFQLYRNRKKHWRQRVLYSFCPQTNCPDSFVPIAPPITDSAGNLYGTTIGANGAPDYGVIYKLTPNKDRSDWTYSILHRFKETDGFYAAYRLSYAGAEAGKPYDGKSPLYGTAHFGGNENPFDGLIFQLEPGPEAQWDYRIVREFCQTPCGGDNPSGSPVVAADGTLYGTTQGDTFYRLTPNGDRSKWRKAFLHIFCSEKACADGDMPVGDLARSASGDFYGVTSQGGRACAKNAQGCGVLYRLSTTGQFTILHKFCALKDCTDGWHPGGVSRDLIGTLIEKSAARGSLNPDPRHNGGVVFSFRNGAFRQLHRFCVRHACTDGYSPLDNLISGDNGSVFGVANRGGAKDAGVVYEIRL